MSALNVDIARTLSELQTLAGFGAAPDGGVSRTSYSPPDLAAREWFVERCEEAGLQLRSDGLGNLFARLPGGDGPAVWSGSHIDSVPNGGAFDGALGVLTALECVRRIAEAQVPLRRPLEVVAWADEEGAYESLLGSRGAIEGFTSRQLAEIAGRDGTPLATGLAAIGSSLAEAAGPSVDPSDVAAFVELHIEQGPVLESEGLDIGVVTDIVEIGRATVTFLGRADHAGTTPMDRRRDPTRAVGEFLAELPGVTAAGTPTAVATCGNVRVAPGAFNIVPERVELDLDLRDRTGQVAGLHAEAHLTARAAAASQEVDVDYHEHETVPGLELDGEIQAMIEAACEARGARYRRMPSGAGHDSQVVGRVIPTAMIFVPSRDGRSHSPAEWTDAGAIEAGANVLLETLLSLAT